MGSNYSATIIEHFRRPRNYGDVEGAEIVEEAHNALCGDRVRIALKVEGDVVVTARFRGDCCAICKASASILTELLAGRTLDDAERLGEAELIAALDAEVGAARLPCVRLPLDAVRAGIERWRGQPT
jgi:nitrogen fixation NifU-like protein